MCTYAFRVLQFTLFLLRVHHHDQTLRPEPQHAVCHKMFTSHRTLILEQLKLILRSFKSIFKHNWVFTAIPNNARVAFSLNYSNSFFLNTVSPLQLILTFLNNKVLKAKKFMIALKEGGLAVLVHVQLQCNHHQVSINELEQAETARWTMSLWLVHLQRLQDGNYSAQCTVPLMLSL